MVCQSNFVDDTKLGRKANTPDNTIRLQKVLNMLELLVKSRLIKFVKVLPLNFENQFYKYRRDVTKHWRF